MSDTNEVRKRVIELFDEIDRLSVDKRDLERQAEEAAKDFLRKAEARGNEIAEKQRLMAKIQQGVYLPSDNQAVKVEDKPKTDKTRAECILEIFRNQPPGTKLRSKDILRYLKDDYGIAHANVTPPLKSLMRKGLLLQDENKGPYTLATKVETEKSPNEQQNQDR